MAIEISFRYILFSKYWYRIIPCDYRLTIRIICHIILIICVTCISYCKVGTSLFCYKNRHFCRNIIHTSHSVCCRISSNGKFSHRKTLMMIKDIVWYIFYVFFLIIKVCTCVFFYHSILKIDFEVKEIKFIEVHLTYMKFSFCFLKNRRCKDLSYRNIYICDTVFKSSFLVRVFKFMDLYI